MDPKAIAAVAAPILGLIGMFLWTRGKAAAVAAIEERLTQLHDEEVAASKTAGTEDDERVKARIAMAKAALAAARAA